MSKTMKVIRAALCTGILVGSAAYPLASLGQDSFAEPPLSGPYVLALEGVFSSAPPPFTGDVLPFKAAQVGRLVFDGTGQARGEATLTFHHPDIPFAVRSRIALHGTVETLPGGRTLISIDEFPLDANGEPAPLRTNSVVYECYVVQRQALLRCVLHSLVSFQQGPQPRNLPLTMAGTLERQR